MEADHPVTRPGTVVVIRSVQREVVLPGYPVQVVGDLGEDAEVALEGAAPPPAGHAGQCPAAVVLNAKAKLGTCVILDTRAGHLRYFRCQSWALAVFYMPEVGNLLHRYAPPLPYLDHEPPAAVPLAGPLPLLPTGAHLAGGDVAELQLQLQKHVEAVQCAEISTGCNIEQLSSCRVVHFLNFELSFEVPC